MAKSKSLQFIYSLQELHNNLELTIIFKNELNIAFAAVDVKLSFTENKALQLVTEVARNL